MYACISIVRGHMWQLQVGTNIVTGYNLISSPTAILEQSSPYISWYSHSKYMTYFVTELLQCKFNKSC